MHQAARESLSADAQAALSCNRLLWRSGIAVLVITGLILSVALLPYTEVKHEPAHGDECNGHSHRRHVIILHRHGERSPVRWYDFEGDWAWDTDDIGIGKLTVNGMKQAFMLGQRLRSAYASHMRLEDEGAVTCYSTDLDRTVDTANSVLLGLLSEHETEPNPVDGVCECRKEHGIRSAPECLASCLQLPEIPKTPEVQVRPRKDADGNPPPDQDAALYQQDVCKGYDAWREKLESSEEWMELPRTKFADASKVSNDLVESELVKTQEWPGGKCAGCLHITEEGYNYLGFMETLWSDLVCYESIGAPYDSKSKYTNEDLFHVLQPLSEFVWKERFAPEAGRMLGGVLLHEWLQVLQKDVEKWSDCKEHDCAGSPTKMTIYSAHDTTVFALLSALGATADAELPGFTANVVMELWETHNNCKGTHYWSVRLLYNHLPLDDPEASPKEQLFTLSPACKDGMCPLDDFIAATQDSVMAPEDCERGSKGVSQHLLHKPLDTKCCTADES